MMFKKNNGKMYNVNAYYAVIDDFITIQLPQNGAFFFDIYDKRRHNVHWRETFSRYLFLNINLIYSATI